MKSLVNKRFWFQNVLSVWGLNFMVKTVLTTYSRDCFFFTVQVWKAIWLSFSSFLIIKNLNTISTAYTIVLHKEAYSYISSSFFHPQIKRGIKYLFIIACVLPTYNIVKELALFYLWSSFFRLYSFLINQFYYTTKEVILPYECIFCSLCSRIMFKKIWE